MANASISALCAPLLVDDAGRLPLLVVRVLDVAEHEDERLRSRRARASTSSGCEAIGDQPQATEFVDLPACDARRAHPRPLYEAEEGVAIGVEAGDRRVTW